MRFTRLGEQGEELVLESDQDNVVFGRQPARGLAIEDPTVSREHARIFLRSGRMHVADLNSSNGTFVNGERVTRAEVHPGDVVRLGSVELRVEGDVPPDAGPSGADGDEEAGIVLEEPAAPAARGPASPSPASRAGGATEPPPTRRVTTADALKSRLPATPEGRARSGGLLRQDVAQKNWFGQLLMILSAIAVATTLFLTVMRLTEKLVPAGETEPANGEGVLDKGIDDSDEQDGG